MGHRHRVGATAIAAGSVLLLVLAGCGRTPRPRAAPTPRPSARPSPRPTPAVSPTPSPTVARAVPTGVQLTDVDFVSPSRGFALGETCTPAGSCRAVVVATTDGGGRWSAAAAPPAAVGTAGAAGAGGGPAATVGRLTFANPLDGWAWGPGLYATSDGAASWSRVAVLGTVLGLAVVGGEVWAVEADCGGAAGTACPLVVETAPAGGGAWTPLGGGPAIDASAADLVATAGGHVWLEAVVPGTGGAGATRVLDTTSDGGATWAPRSLPCPSAASAAPAPLAAYGASTLWVGCVSEPAAGSQAKAVYTSSDAGVTWSLAGSTGPAGAGVPAAQGRVPIGGYLDQLALTGPEVGWMALGRGPLLVSRDGGRTWSPAISAGEVAAGSGVVRVSFAGGLALAVADGVTLPGGATAGAVVFTSADAGLTWHPVPLG